MGFMLFVVQKEINGSLFSNTHCIAVSGEQRAATVAEVGAVIAPTFLDNTGGLSPLDNGSILWSILEFERQMLPGLVRFKRCLVTDRKNYQAGPDNVKAFKSFALNFPGARTDIVANNVEQGAVILSITRRGSGVGAEDGELELRNCLSKEDTRNIGRNQLDWSGDGSRTKYGGLLDTAIGTSGLANYFFNGQGEAGPIYAIPRYASEARGDAFPGSIIGGGLVEGLVILGPANRQVRGGKKRKKEE